jgi:hypothetical protein
MKNIGFGLARLAVLALAASMLCGCAWSIGGTKKGETSMRPTRGQELIDLQRARDQGALTDTEYEDQRLRILSR